MVRVPGPDIAPARLEPERNPRQHSYGLVVYGFRLQLRLSLRVNLFSMLANGGIIPFWTWQSP
jgi:hypothetical protein